MQVLGTQSTLDQGQVSVTARVTGGFALHGVARGYLETPLGQGTLQAAVAGPASPTRSAAPTACS